MSKRWQRETKRRQLDLTRRLHYAQHLRQDLYNSTLSADADQRLAVLQHELLSNQQAVETTQASVVVLRGQVAALCEASQQYEQQRQQRRRKADGLMAPPVLLGGDGESDDDW